MRPVKLCLATLLTVVLASPAALAAGRVALVVGNSAYAAIGALPNPGNDATDVAAALGRLGFDVTTVRDADRVGMSEALRIFTRESAGADVSLVFYAGHGLEMDGVNYLVPVDAQLERDTDVRFEAVVLDDVLAATVGAGLRIVILDACRNNPLARSMQRTGASRNVSRGSFGELDENLLGDETLVAYAAAAGTTAADGTGRNSPYTTALLELPGRATGDRDPVPGGAWPGARGDRRRAAAARVRVAARRALPSQHVRAGDGFGSRGRVDRHRGATGNRILAIHCAELGSGRLRSVSGAVPRWRLRAACSEPGESWSRRWLYDRLGLFSQLPGRLSAERTPGTNGHINLETKTTGKPSAGNRHAGFDEAGAGNVPTGAGLRPGAKATENPPDPIGGAPVLDPTAERRLETESWRGVRHRHRRKPPATATPCAYRHRASRRLYLTFGNATRPPIVSSTGRFHARVGRLERVDPRDILVNRSPRLHPVARDRGELGGLGRATALKTRQGYSVTVLV